MKIYVYIHVCCINNWKDIFMTLYHTIRESGLYDNVSGIKCNVLTKDSNDATFFTDLMDSKLEVIGINDNLNLYETPTINLLHEHAKTEDFYVLYLHTKGVKHNGGLIYVTDWVNYLIHFNIKKHATCIAALSEYDAVGVNLHRGAGNTHYSGNFWWSTSDYIKKLDTCVYQDYISPELWLTCTDRGKYLSLWDSHTNHYAERYEAHRYS